MENKIYLFNNCKYDKKTIYDLLPDNVFFVLKKAKKVVLKPNWVKQAHMERPGEWDYVITHPEVISAVLKKTIELMPGDGEICIIDGPEMTTNFEELISHYPVAEWQEMASRKGIKLSVIDLREDVWYVNSQLVVRRDKKRGDPKGNTDINLKGDLSEFHSHKKSKQGYFGADSDIKETNNAHNGIDNLYRLSRTIIECDVFINIPKLKTHKKSGITACLKNLVGINTYRNFLPHYSIGTRDSGGDQFPNQGALKTIESKLNPLFHQYIRTSPVLSRIFSPVMKLGRVIFGANKKTNRSGSWYGNDTIWRMILDINKILFYSNPSGELRTEQLRNRKHYIGIVDAILCGEGYGPKTPDPIELNNLVIGTNPVSIDTVCSLTMGFDPLLIPSIRNAFVIKRYPIVNFKYEDIKINTTKGVYNILSLPNQYIKHFNPAPGWKGHIEK